MLSNRNSHINEKDQYENNLLHQAVISKKPEIVKMLYTHPDINVNGKNKFGDTPLYHAVLCDEPEIVKILLTHPNINVGEEILNRDILKDRPKIAEILRLHEANLSEKAG